MKKYIIRILIRLLGAPYYGALSQNEVKSLLTRLATEEGFEKLPAYFEQCATQARNQYLYTGNEMFKGSVLAFTELREKILMHRLTKNGKVSENERKIQSKNIY